VIEDLSGHYTPEGWAHVAVDAAHRYNCGLAVEKTYGQKMVDAVLRTVPGGGVVPLYPAPTKVGKVLRAEPVVALYEQHRVHHVGTHGELEGQMTTWVPGEGDSPDRVDALVHAITYLLVEARAGEKFNPARQTRRIPQ
jgi:phage terminase large subunit-like protein